MKLLIVSMHTYTAQPVGRVLSSSVVAANPGSPVSSQSELSPVIPSTPMSLTPRDGADDAPADSSWLSNPDDMSPKSGWRSRTRKRGDNDGASQREILLEEDGYDGYSVTDSPDARTPNSPNTRSRTRAYDENERQAAAAGWFSHVLFEWVILFHFGNL